MHCSCRDPGLLDELGQLSLKLIVSHHADLLVNQVALSIDEEGMRNAAHTELRAAIDIVHHREAVAVLAPEAFRILRCRRGYCQQLELTLVRFVTFLEIR